MSSVLSIEERKHCQYSQLQGTIFKVGYHMITEDSSFRRHVPVLPMNLSKDESRLLDKASAKEMTGMTVAEGQLYPSLTMKYCQTHRCSYALRS